jgi:hypothetical protein
MTARADSGRSEVRGSELRNSVVIPEGPWETQTVRLIPFLVGFYFSFRAILVLVAVRVFLLEPRMGVALGLDTEFALLLLVGFHAAGPFVRSTESLRRQTSFRWVLVFLLYSGCSLAWSGTVSLSASFLYWCGLAADVVLVFALLLVDPVVEVAHSLMRGFVCATCVLAFVAWMMPVGADLRLGDPDYFNTNQIGNLCAFAIFLAQYLASRKDGQWTPAIVFLILTMVRSLSKTTLVAFLVSEVFFLLLNRSMSRKSKISIVGCGALVVLVFWGLFESYYHVYTTAGNQAQTLTGRVAIWSYSLQASLEKPWFGNGFDAMWKVFPPFGNEQFEARHAENELLQQFFAYGVVGVGLLCGLYGSICRSLRRLPLGTSRTLLASLMLFILIRGCAEAEPFDLLFPLWAITVFSAVFAETRVPNSQASSISVSGTVWQSAGRVPL